MIPNVENLNSEILSNMELDNNYIITIGASAGGLEAIHDFFDNMPEADNLSFVIVQHLSSDYKSLLVELVAKHTFMKVQEAEDGLAVEPQNVYVIPPGKIITLNNRRLSVKNKPADKATLNVIDQFLISQAKFKKNKSIAVILSGTGTDGTKGCEEIKNNGGLVIVQDPITAKFDGMPNSIINSGYLDYILSPELMPVQIFDFIQETLPSTLWDDNDNTEGLLDDIFKSLFKHTGCDFQFYKRPTILRRIARRMAFHKHKSLQEYVKFILANIEENKTLCKDFLIGVTRFFRDKQAFDTITNVILPQWKSNAKNEDTFKVWVPACSTGQEAYSLAILIREYFRINGIRNPIKIFASDIDQSAIDTASKGIYSAAIEKEIDVHLLSNYFIRDGDKYQISQDIRKLIVFAKHNIITDPPFIRNDLVSCRNMLIYMDISLQKKILATLYFSINPGGYLFLGPSETPSMISESLEDIDLKWKIYQKHPDGKNHISIRQTPFSHLQDQYKFRHNSLKEKENISNYEKLFTEALVNENNCACIFIDKNYTVKEAMGNYRSYLSLPSQNFQLNITKMVAPDVAISLNSALRKCLKTNTKVEVLNLKVKTEEKLRFINITINPPTAQSYGYFYILFSQNKYSDKVEKYEEGGFSIHNSQQTNDYIHELKAELHETESHLQQAIENLENANQELQSTNEEMLSANEELQSSNEELQSLNEELHTLNTEHQQKIGELISLNDDLNNYFRNSDVGQIFVDSQLRIRKFNPVSTRMINLIENDINRPIHNITTNLKNINLTSEIKNVLETRSPMEKEVDLSNGRICLLRLTPYIRQDKSFDGVVLSFVDISAIKELNSLVKATFNSSSSPILAVKPVRDIEGAMKDFQITLFNKAACEYLQKSASDLQFSSLRESFPAITLNDMEDRLLHVFETGKEFHTELEDSKNASWFLVSALRMRDGLVITCNNITKQKKAEKKLLATISELENTSKYLEESNQDLQQFASVASHDLKEPLRKIQMICSLLSNSISPKLNEKELKQLNTVTTSVDRMRTLIDDLLDYSKLSVLPAYDFIDLNNLMKECLADLQASIIEKEAIINVSSLPTIYGMPIRIRQCLQNFLSNALKYSNPKVSVIIDVWSKRIGQNSFNSHEDKNGAYYLITIKDNGKGFDQKFAEKIFTMFFRLDNNIEGTGIGLAVCKKIIEQHNGKIRALSEIGKGTEIQLIIPAPESNALHC